MTAVWDNDHCLSRGPGLTHTLNGAPGSPCEQCGAPVYVRSRVATAVNPDAPEKPIAEPAAPRLRTADDCGCRPCHSDDPRYAQEKADHAFAHEQFRAFLAAREPRRVVEPSDERILLMLSQEFHAPTLSPTCDWPEHAGMPRHSREH